MSEKRRTYKTDSVPAKKLVKMTFRITEEEQNLIRQHTREAGFRTESEYLRHLCCFPNPSAITDSELQNLKTDIIYCREWIEEHKDLIENAVTAIHLFLKLFS